MFFHLELFQKCWPHAVSCGHLLLVAITDIIDKFNHRRGSDKLSYRHTIELCCVLHRLTEPLRTQIDVGVHCTIVLQPDHYPIQQQGNVSVQWPYCKMNESETLKTSLNSNFGALTKILFKTELDFWHDFVQDHACLCSLWLIIPLLPAHSNSLWDCLNWFEVKRK